MRLFLSYRLRKPKKKQRAFTLTELAVVLGVVGVILGSIWYTAEIVRDNSRVTNAIGQMNIVAQNMTNMLQAGYGASIAASTDITIPMINAQVIPSWATNSATTATHPWGGKFVMYWSPVTAKSYRMSFYNVTSQSACIALINQATACTPGQPGCPMYIVVAANGGNYTDLRVTTLTSTIVQNICALNSYTGGANSVEFDFTQ